ncbi:MAG: copper resistance protein CopC [Acidobacteria bacterium]|jgi:copper resistance protein C|nr:copper resistance protein CopC [Acidobacteriota bacterium]
MAKRTMGWLVLVLAMAATTTVLAHMKLAKSMPAAGAVVAGKPAKVQIWFTQAPDRAVSKITVSGASGEVKLGALTVDADKSMSATVDGATPDGTYTVAWQAAGDDGHVQKGDYTFSVRQTR